MPAPGTARHLGAALSAGVVCGGLWFLSATMILDIVRPGGVVVPALVLGAVAGFAAAALFWRPGTARQIWGRAILTVGFHALALPAVAAIAFGATAIWPPPETADLGLSLDVFGVRLVGTPTTVRLGFGGFVLGVLLVVIGERALGRRRIQDRIPRAGRLPR
jgi:hypothetical protein